MTTTRSAVKDAPVACGVQKGKKVTKARATAVRSTPSPRKSPSKARKVTLATKQVRDNRATPVAPAATQKKSRGDSESTGESPSDSSEPVTNRDGSRPAKARSSGTDSVMAQLLQDFRRERAKKRKAVQLLKAARRRIKELEERERANGRDHGMDGTSVITQDSMSNEDSKLAMANIAAEWFLTTAPETITGQSDLRPFRSPFPYQHWGPFANGDLRFIDVLGTKFLAKRMKAVSDATRASFMLAYKKGKPSPLKKVFASKRCNFKSDKIGKRAERHRRDLLKLTPPVAIKTGSEWRLDPARAERGGPGSCPLFSAKGAADFFDETFSKGPEYLERDPAPERRFVSISQLALIDAMFQHKAGSAAKKATSATPDTRDFGAIAKGTDGQALETATALALELWPLLKEKQEICSCCVLVDLEGLPPPLQIGDDEPTRVGDPATKRTDGFGSPRDGEQTAKPTDHDEEEDGEDDGELTANVRGDDPGTAEASGCSSSECSDLNEDEELGLSSSGSEDED